VKERFEGPEGVAYLLEALRRQRVVQGDNELAERLRNAGQLVEFANDEQFITQGNTDTDVFMLLAGRVQVFVNRRQVGVRVAGEAVGEMVAVNLALTRTASVKSDGISVALKIPAARFAEAGSGSPTFWKHIAVITGERLAEREKFLRPSNDLPVMFVASSVRSLPIAEAIEYRLKHEDLRVTLWTQQGVFGPTRTPVDSLFKVVNECDYAAFIFGPDDTIGSGEATMLAPRDNVVFELGLFMSRLGKERVFIVKDNTLDLKIPTDLLGVTMIDYVPKPPGAQPREFIGPVCTDIVSVIRDKWVF
jgi:CRP/FNR family cyclic AMP-dependent transcriptional regulator